MLIEHLKRIIKKSKSHKNIDICCIKSLHSKACIFYKETVTIPGIIEKIMTLLDYVLPDKWINSRFQNGEVPSNQREIITIWNNVS